MSGIERIYDKIINDANDQVDVKIKETLSKIDSARKAVDEKLQEYKAVQLSEAEKEAKNIILRAQANRNLEGKKQLLSIKQEMISQVFDKAHKSLMEMEDSKKLSLYMKLINKSLQKGHNEILLNKKDKLNFGEQLISEIQDHLGDGFHVNLSEQHIQDDFGVIVKNGNIYSNSTFATLLKYSKQELEADVMKILFERGVQA
ncbi:MAG TPA: hypothetical protein PL054_08125 [Clostridia bacterium]|jgi:V/A-type H+-transporting ATPase subunit E|nr:MAG: V-type ATP synthase subunit E [Firmicutes bacterium ADurb.Bin146]HOD93827.1 hypothetical protein [Clostridia bacterium]